MTQINQRRCFSVGIYKLIVLGKNRIRGLNYTTRQAPKSVGHRTALEPTPMWFKSQVWLKEEGDANHA